MGYEFLNTDTDKNDLSNHNAEMISPVLLENNKEQLKKFFDFYEADNQLLYINGFLGTGKVQLAEYSFNFLSEETIILKYNCFETTILDDIFLSFFEEFKNLIIKHTINDPKVKTENFTQKINTFFASIDKPIVIFLNSFDSILKENRQDIMNFLQHLMSLKKVKIILVAKVYEGNLFPTNFKISRVTTTALNKHLFEKFIKEEKVNFSPLSLDEFYKQTRGYYFYTMLSLKIIENQKIDLDKFIKAFKDSYLTFYEFLEKKSLEIIPAISVQFFWFLCLLRHGAPVNLLKTMNFCDEENINFLLDNKIIIKDNDIIYVPGFFKEQVDATIPKNITVKIHKYIYDMYQQQLPLKPMERTVLLSRQTMRNEIEYHGLFIPKRYTNEGEQITSNHLTYAPIDKPVTDAEFKHGEDAQDALTSPPDMQIQTGKTGFGNINLKGVKVDFNDSLFKLSPEEIALLQSDSEIDGKGIDEEAFALEVIKEKEPETFKELLDSGLKAENNYDFKKVITYYTKALNFKAEPEYFAELPVIYRKIANAYKQITDWTNTLKYLNYAKEFYEDTQKYNIANEVRFDIANIYYETYKIDKAKDLLKWVLGQPDNSNLLITKVCIALAKIEEDLSDIESAFNYYKIGIEKSNPSMELELLTQLYFKYALISDDKDDLKEAFTYYEKCIQLSSDPHKNKYLSSAYTNLAALYLEEEDIEMAFRQYEKAFELDKEINSAEGMFFATLKMGQLLEYENPNQALEYFIMSKNYSMKMDDKFYMASASLALGDFYFDHQNDTLALSEYYWTQDLVKDEFSQDNLNKIQSRIDDIRYKLGDEKFYELDKSIRQ